MRGVNGFENLKGGLGLLLGLFLAATSLAGQNSCGITMRSIRPQAFKAPDRNPFMKTPRLHTPLRTAYMGKPFSPSAVPTFGQGLLRWSAEELPFFCRIEHKLARKAILPVKFRLGSVQYVDWLEGKTPWPGL
jgi:hypothetical protein